MARPPPVNSSAGRLGTHGSVRPMAGSLTAKASNMWCVCVCVVGSMFGADLPGGQSIWVSILGSTSGCHIHCGVVWCGWGLQKCVCVVYSSSCAACVCIPAHGCVEGSSCDLRCVCVGNTVVLWLPSGKTAGCASIGLTSPWACIQGCSCAVYVVS